MNKADFETVAAREEGVSVTLSKVTYGVHQAIYRKGNREALITRFKGNRTWSADGATDRPFAGKFPVRLIRDASRKVAIEEAIEYCVRG